MKDLAVLIRKGLESGVTEERASWGIVVDGNVTSANVVGLALIGKVGLEKAHKLIEKAFAEREQEESLAGERVAHELGLTIDQCESLVMDHFRATATQIAESLEKGTYKFDPA